MAIYVRPFVTSIAHVEGCRRNKCGSACVRKTDGWEYRISLVLPNGERFEERKKSPVNGKTATLRYAEERTAHAVRTSVLPAVTAKKEVPTVREFAEAFLTYSLVAKHVIVRRTLWNGQEGPPKGGRNRKVRFRASTRLPTCHQRTPGRRRMPPLGYPRSLPVPRPWNL